MITKFVEKMKSNKIGNFIIKYHILYFLPAIILVLAKVFVYKLIVNGVSEIHHINMEIDNYIPMIKYFYVFYFTYYWYPAVLIIVLMLYNRKGFWITILTVIFTNIIAMSTFALYQVQMIRPIEYEVYDSFKEVFIGFKNVSNISEFFDECIKMQYHMDEGAYNCMPSLHASLGTIEVLLGLNVLRDKKKTPTWFNITNIILGIGTTLSTVFIKQHYFVDMIAGIVLTICVYLVIAFVLNRLENKDILVYYKNTNEDLVYKTKKEKIREALESKALFKFNEYVNFRYRDDLMFGYIYNIKIEDEKVIYDISIAGQCPSVIENISEDLVSKRA